MESNKHAMVTSRILKISHHLGRLLHMCRLRMRHLRRQLLHMYQIYQPRRSDLSCLLAVTVNVSTVPSFFETVTAETSAAKLKYSTLNLKIPQTS